MGKGEHISTILLREKGAHPLHTEKLQEIIIFVKHICFYVQGGMLINPCTLRWTLYSKILYIYIMILLQIYIFLFKKIVFCRSSILALPIAYFTNLSTVQDG